MSKPRYDRWPYVKGMIRRYPELCSAEADLRSTSMTAGYSMELHGKGRTGDPVANAAMRQLPEVNRRELAAVRHAIAVTRTLPAGDERLSMVRMVYWSRTHTFDGAALSLYRSRRTVLSWHGEFVREVARGFGLLE